MLIIYRSLLKDKIFLAINVIGLAVAMAVCLLIAQYVKIESSYESFVPHAEDIYRVTLDRTVNNERIGSFAENYSGVGPALAALPEVDDFTRLYNLGYKNNVIITNEEAKPQPIAVKQNKFLYADSSFLMMMGYQLEEGDITTALVQPNSAVITREFARIYFGESDAIGKVLHMRDDDNNDELVKVTGVVNTVPRNTHLKFDVLFSYSTLYKRVGKRPDYATFRFNGWNRAETYTYVRLHAGTNPKEVESKLPAIVAINKDQSKGQQDFLHLQPLKTIHLTSKLSEEFEPNGNGTIVNFLGLIGIFVLIIGWINYINLSTAKAMERAKEVGVRKVMGAMPRQLLIQFLAEAAAVNFISVVIAYFIGGLMLPWFNSVSGLALAPIDFIQPWFLGLMLVLWIGGTVLSGFYPAVVLSSFKASHMLRGKLRTQGNGAMLRKSLVVFQFMASVALIAGTIIVYDQLNFMMSQDIGMNIDQVLVLQRPGISPPRTGSRSMDMFRHELLKDPSILAVTGTNTIPGMRRHIKEMVKRYGTPDEEQISVRLNSMDYNTNDVFEMNVLAGRVFSESFPYDADTAIVITESASKLLGFKTPKDAINQTLTFTWPWNPIIVGVVNDYHQLSFKESLEPSIFYCDPFEGEYYSLRIKSSNLAETISHVRQSWEKSFPGNPFEYFFLDQYFNQQYQNEQRFGHLFTAFAMLALIIGCLGLFGLSAYTASQRTKEIGIRKVLGSSEWSLFILLSVDYIKLIAIAIIAGVPVIYIVMNQWLNSFAYRVPITAIIFVIAGTVVLLISLLTVSFQTIKVARENPINSLRYE